MTFSAEISVVVLVLRLITSSESVSDDTLEVDTESIDSRTIEVSTTDESLTFRNRLTRETAKSRSICLSEIASVKDELLLRLSVDD